MIRRRPDNRYATNAAISNKVNLWFSHTKNKSFISDAVDSCLITNSTSYLFRLAATVAAIEKQTAPIMCGRVRESACVHLREREREREQVREEVSVRVCVCASMSKRVDVLESRQDIQRCHFVNKFRLKIFFQKSRHQLTISASKPFSHE